MAWVDLPPLNTLVAFEAAVRLRSVTRAAEELHLTHGAVSRQLKILERSIGTSLFRRDGRSLRPTDAGLTFSTSVAGALELLCAATREVRPTDLRAPFVLSCEPTLMMRWLIARLPTLDPAVSLHLSAAGGPIDLARQGVDAAIRRNDFPIPEGLGVSPIFAEWIGPVSSPDVAASLRSPADLGAVSRLESATRPSAWQTWATLSAATVPDTKHRTFEHFYLSLEAATAGLGVAIGPYALVKNDLEAGRLVAPFGFLADGSQYVFLAPQGNDSRVERVRRWLESQATDSIPPTSLRLDERGWGARALHDC